MEQFLIALYSCVGAISLIGYIPQIVKLWKSKSNTGVSTQSWFTWSGCYAVTLCYSLIVVNDVLLAAVAAINLISCGIIFTLAVYYGRKMEPVPSTASNKIFR